ncbi:phage tail protein [Aquimarina sp. BL5]|uniref:phage tail protein n=1 Tax=Aquimarina sp. BL5 TaxID=1714860 RepID=UPI000E539007|nr:phage tail protein [Aquimarina sp. BL5]AXT52361.1 phage tail protein [Aquimarina sp. BL5]RKN10275.1 phage tail protein [Aquimarina sp. BL5]
MALTKEQIKADYPLVTYNYRVDINGESISFSEVSGLELSFETHTYKESFAAGGKVGPNIMYMPGQIQPVNISMKKGLVKGKSIPIFYDWINSTQLNQIDKRDIVVHLLDETGSTMVSWKVIDAFPTKLTAPSFDASSNDVAIESMDLMAFRVTMEEA